MWSRTARQRCRLEPCSAGRLEFPPVAREASARSCTSLHQGMQFCPFESSVSDRELTQLASTAKHYLDATDALLVPDMGVSKTVTVDAAGWPVDRQPRPLSPLDTYPPTSPPSRCDWRPFTRSWLVAGHLASNRDSAQCLTSCSPVHQLRSPRPRGSVATERRRSADRDSVGEDDWH